MDEAVDLPGEIELQDGVYEVGREEPADVVIPVPTVSGRHALLRISEFCITLHHCDDIPPLFMSNLLEICLRNTPGSTDFLVSGRQFLAAESLDLPKASMRCCTAVMQRAGRSL